MILFLQTVFKCRSCIHAVILLLQTVFTWRSRNVVLYEIAFFAERDIPAGGCCFLSVWKGEGGADVDHWLGVQ
jgi:hypothetical protein